MRTLFTIIVLVIGCIVCGASLGVTLILGGLIFIVAIGYGNKLGCFGVIINLILLLIAATLIISGFCLL